MPSIPQSFDFGGALEPDYVVKCSYGNDSIATLQFLREYNDRHPLGKVVVLFNDTGFAADWWTARVAHGENFVIQIGFIPCRTESKGMLQLILERNMWPDSQARFCTEELKILPTLSWLSIHDPKGLAITVCGARREESLERRNWPEYIKGERTSENRDQWSPLVLHTAEMRNELIRRAGWEVLPHRSRECRCVLANATDLKTWKETDVVEIEAWEAKLGERQKGKNRFMFDPVKKKGRPEGIRAVIEWAKGVKTKEPASGGCDSGYCTG